MTVRVRDTRLFPVALYCLEKHSVKEDTEMDKDVAIAGASVDAF